jgi:hypothetical protein
MLVLGMGFQKKNYLDGGVGGWGQPYPYLFWIIGIILIGQDPLEHTELFPATN